MPSFLVAIVCHRVEVEVSRILVHPLHYDLSLLANPVVHINTQILALLGKAHLVPLGFVESWWARRVWYLHIATHHGAITAKTQLRWSYFTCASHIGSRTASELKDIAVILFAVYRTIESRIVSLTTIRIAKFNACSFRFGPAFLSHLLPRHLVKALLVLRWRLNNAVEKLASHLV